MNAPKAAAAMERITAVTSAIVESLAISMPRRRTATWVAAQVLGLLLVTSTTYAQIAAPDVVGALGGRQIAQTNQTTDARSTSCPDLKSKVRDAGSLAVATGPAGGDIFHARAPQCDVWHRPHFSFVVAQDGWCGVGYVCAGKLQK